MLCFNVISTSNATIIADTISVLYVNGMSTANAMDKDIAINITISISIDYDIDIFLTNAIAISFNSYVTSLSLLNFY